jgi:hypothetical protein
MTSNRWKAPPPPRGPVAWSIGPVDLRGILAEDPRDRREDQMRLNAAGFLPYQCRPNAARPRHLRTRAVHQHARSGRRSTQRQAANRSGAGAATSAGGNGAGRGGDGGDGDGDGGGPGRPPPSPELLALVDDLADFAADLFLAGRLSGREKP